MRRCIERKDIAVCWECETCDKLTFLEATHGDAHIRNLRRIRKGGEKAFCQGKRDWYHKKRE